MAVVVLSGLCLSLAVAVAVLAFRCIDCLQQIDAHSEHAASLLRAVEQKRETYRLTCLGLNEELDLANDKLTELEHRLKEGGVTMDLNELNRLVEAATKDDGNHIGIKEVQAVMVGLRVVLADQTLPVVQALCHGLEKDAAAAEQDS